MLHHLFTSKSETLAQSLLEYAIKGIFNSLLLSVLSLFLISWVEQSIERASRRAALKDFKNEALTQSLDTITGGYSQRACLRNRFDVVGADCKTEISEFLVEVMNARFILVALFPNDNFRQLAEFIDHLEEIRSLGSQTPAEQARIDDISSSFNGTVDEVALNFE